MRFVVKRNVGIGVVAIKIQICWGRKRRFKGDCGGGVRRSGSSLHDYVGLRFNS